MITKIAFAEKTESYNELNAFITKLAMDNGIAKSTVKISMDKNEAIIYFANEGN